LEENGQRVASTTKKVHGFTIALSIGLHVAVTAGLSWMAMALAPRSHDGEKPPAASLAGADDAPGSSTAAIAVELPVAGEGVLIDERTVDPTGEPPRATAGDTVARLDTGSAGRGGETQVRTPALNLADANDRMRLSPDLVSRLDRDQLQRLRVARIRQSWEDRRSTTHPAELTLLVTGAGTVLERRVASRTMPSRGALESRAASVRGGDIGASSPDRSPDAERALGGARLGSLEGAPGSGVMRAAAGIDHRASAPIASARPDVTRGPVAVPAPTSARPRDDVDSEQEVATTVRSLVHASSAGGTQGDGQGGAGGGGESAAGGASGAGSSARPLGLGEGDVFDYWTSDPRLLPYFRQIHAKIDPLWASAFPKSALLELKQGTVILEFTVSADGHAVVSWPPARPSGVDEFDRNCAEAIRRAAPFPPIPSALGVHSLRIRAPFVASNPIVK
jgi:TonB family protein